ncbi:MAG: NADH-quinone oxidoreductase subunit A [Verrucomicrobiota bacterium]
MEENYAPVLLQCLVAAALAAAILILSVVLGKSARSNAIKDSAYECGMLPVGDGQARFSVKFYLVAMLFVIFDIEVVFLYPWAVTFQEIIPKGLEGLQSPPFVSMISFLIILFIAYLYALKKGALKWR